MQATTHACVRDNMRDKKQKNARERNNAEMQNLPPELLDLMAQDEEPKMNYTGILIAILVILFILSLIAMATYLTMPTLQTVIRKDPLTFQKLKDAKSLLKQFQYQHISNSSFIVYRNGTNNGTKFYRTWFSKDKLGQTEILFELNMKNIEEKDISVSTDLKYALIRVQFIQNSMTLSIWKYRLISIYNLQKTSIILTIGPDHLNELSQAAWGPSNQDLTAVDKKGNIHWSKSPTKQFSFACLSCNLDQSRMYGVFIGLYQKIFRSDKGFWWNKSGSKLAFVSLAKENDKLLFINNMNEELHPELKSELREPAYKVKELYDVRLFIFSKSSKIPQKIKLPKYLRKSSFYLVHVAWLTDSELLLVTMNRRQQQAIITVCNVDADDCFQIFTQNISNGFIDLADFQSIKFVENLKQIILITRTSQSSPKAIITVKLERPPNNKHWWIGRYDTKRNVELISLANYYPLTNDILYMGLFTRQNINSTSTSKENQYFRTNLITGHTSCLTCSNRHFDWCKQHEAEWFSNAGFIHVCHSEKNNSQSSPPIYSLHTTENLLDNHVRNFTTKIILESNNLIRQFTRNISMPTTFTFYIPMKTKDYPHESYTLTAKLHRPYDLNPVHITKYPMALLLSDMHLQRLTYDRFQLGFKDYLVSYLRYVVVEIFPRSYQGQNYVHWSHSLDKLMTHTDTYDVTRALTYLLDKENYIDEDSLIVIGEKYGAYLSLKQLQNSQKIPKFRCAVMIDPILDFRKYSFFFTEKYLGNFSSQRINYETSVLKATPEIVDKETLFIADVAKEPVLFEGLARYLKNLVKLGALYNILPFYDSSTDYSWNSNQFVMKYMTRHLVNCVNKTKLIYPL